jgi:hypothetical protein
VLRMTTWPLQLTYPGLVVVASGISNHTLRLGWCGSILDLASHQLLH